MTSRLAELLKADIHYSECSTAYYDSLQRLDDVYFERGLACLRQQPCEIAKCESQIAEEEELKKYWRTTLWIALQECARIGEET